MSIAHGLPELGTGRTAAEDSDTPAPQHEPGTKRTWRELGRALRRPGRLVTTFVMRASDDDVFMLAAALAYYFFFSIFPMLLFVLAMASLLPIQGLEAWLLWNAQLSLPADAYTAVADVVQGLLSTPRGGLLSLGAALALWTASSGMSGLMSGLNRAYRVQDTRPWWRVRLHAIGLTVVLSALMIVAFVLALFGGIAVDLITSRLGPLAGTAALVIRWGLTLGAVTLLVAAIYYACPAVEKDWQWIRPGSALFTVGFVGASTAFSHYVSRFGAYDKTYGSLGAIIVLLLWMYLLALFLLLGGELNALLEERLVRRGEAPLPEIRTTTDGQPQAVPAPPPR